MEGETHSPGLSMRGFGHDNFGSNERALFAKRGPCPMPFSFSVTERALPVPSEPLEGGNPTEDTGNSGLVSGPLPRPRFSFVTSFIAKAHAHLRAYCIPPVRASLAGLARLSWQLCWTAENPVYARVKNCRVFVSTYLSLVFCGSQSLTHLGFCWIW